MQAYGKSDQPFLIVHGGAGSQDPSGPWLEAASREIIEIAQQAAVLLSNNVPLDPVERALAGMEDCPHFNAGLGAALQADGQARLTAAVMDGDRQSFSGVISITNVKNPSHLARHLQNRSSRVLTAPGHDILARQLEMPVVDLITKQRMDRWITARQNHGLGDCDTVGCVVWTPAKTLAAGTSTGGRGYEFPGRVSDCATVAGNYATTYAAISATGIGEEIVDDAVAARLETRVRDGKSLEDASRLAFAEATTRQRGYGWIAVDAKGHWAVAHTTPAMTYAVVTMRGDILISSLSKN